MNVLEPIGAMHTSQRHKNHGRVSVLGGLNRRSNNKLLRLPPGWVHKITGAPSLRLLFSFLFSAFVSTFINISSGIFASIVMKQIRQKNKNKKIVKKKYISKNKKIYTVRRLLLAQSGKDRHDRQSKDTDHD